MIRLASSIDENAWVVADIDRATDFWVKLGYGPFFVTTMDIADVRYRGARISLQLKVAMARAGDVHLELIQQLNDGPSAYRDMFAAGQGGLHHIRQKAVTSGEPALNYDDLLAEFARQGTDCVMEMHFGANRIAYMDTRTSLGCMMEIAEPCDAIEAFKRLTLEASHNWDGTDPVRPLDLSVL